MNPENTAPRDGSRILLCYRTRLFCFRDQDWRDYAPKWEECRWVSDKARTGSEPHWEPWTGDARTNTTAHISPARVIGWVPLPA